MPGDASHEAFVQALLSSPTFWRGPVVWIFASLGCVLILATMFWKMRRRLSLRGLLTDSSGAAAAVDFVITLPVFLTVMSFFIQFALLAQASLIVHYSAYTAARSARVWLWDRDGAFLDAVPLSRSIIAYKITSLTDEDDVKKRVERAARFPLIAISPAKPLGSDPALDTALAGYLNNVAGLYPSNQSKRRSAYAQKARYAFNPSNSTVEYSSPLLPALDGSATGIFNGIKDGSEKLKSGDAWPVVAAVTFRFYLVVPLGGAVFGDWNGSYYVRNMHAEVRLL